MKITTSTKLILTLPRFLFLILFLTTNPRFIEAQDTAFYPNGSIKEICERNDGNRECEFFEIDGSPLKLPRTIEYINYISPMQQGKVIDIKSITEPEPVPEVQLWRLSKLLGLEYFDMEEKHSFSIKVNDTLSSYFISAINNSDPEFFIYLNDSTYITLPYPPAVMTSPEITAISFQDYDKNGRTDIAYIIRYVTGAGPTGSWDRYDSAILLNRENGFQEKFYSGTRTISELIQKYQSE